MPKNKQALLRYQIIDACLSNRFHVSDAGNIAGFWPANELAESVSDELGFPVASRTIRKDIQDMKNGVLGIPVPVANKRGKGYYYSQKGFHLFTMRLTPNETFHLSEAVHHIDHLMTHKYFRQLSGSLKKLNINKIPANDMVLHLEPYNNPPAYAWLKKLVDAIENKHVLQMKYQPFYPLAQIEIEIHPYLIKEYNQRLYVLAWDATNEEYFVFGLDRIKGLKPVNKKWHVAPADLKSAYFKHIVGVSLPRNMKVETIQIQIRTSRLPYILSKPLHPTQNFVERKGDWALLEYELIVNRDLKQWILAKGKDARVIAPGHLRSDIAAEIEKTNQLYA